jgi:hypothetical protein
LTNVFLSDIVLIVVNIDSIAQLGERYLDKVEVTGSSPVGVTIKSLSITARFLVFRVTAFFIKKKAAIQRIAGHS